MPARYNIFLQANINTCIQVVDNAFLDLTRKTLSIISTFFDVRLCLSHDLSGSPDF